MRAMPFDCGAVSPLRRDEVLGCPSWRIEHYPNDSCYACKRDEEAGKLHAEDDGKGDGHGKYRQGRGEVPPECPKGIAQCAPDQHSKQNLAIVDQPFGPEIRRNRRRLNQASELCLDRRKELRREEFRHSMGEGRFPEV